VLGKPGGFGITYLATDTHLQQSVAIKEYLPSDFAVREGRSTVYVKSSSYEDNFKWGLDNFIKEARALARFTHPNIVRVLRFFEANGTAYMVMEYQEGRSLTDYLAERRILTEDELKTIVEPLLDGLIEIHKANLLHRDIKPNNIYIRHDESPVLLDFGSARYAVGQKTRSVTSIVTPGYAPLEQYDDEIKDQGAWTDIYALGAVMYRAISGEAPPAATRRVMKDPMIPAVKKGNGKYNKNLLQAIDWALKLSEEDRPKTVDEWRAKMFAPHHPPTVFPTKEVVQSHWPIVSITGIFFIFLLSTMLTILWYNNQTLESEIATAQKERKIAEKQLKVEQKRRKSAEQDFRQSKALIDEIRQFKPQMVDNLATKYKITYEIKYYDVMNVEANDILNVREFPGHQNNIVAKIPPAEKCVEFLGDYRLNDCQVWIKVRYQNTQGWVNSSFLMGSGRCDEEEELE
jgi:serine/threonine protein kinase